MMRHTRPPAAGVLLLTCFALGAAPVPWQARWIIPRDVNDAPRPNSWFAFRRDIEVAAVPARCVLRIACDSKYWLWVNGVLVVREGGLKRGPSPTGTYYDRVVLDAPLRVGPNALAVLVWHFGKHGFSHNDSGRIGLLIDGGGEGVAVRTDTTWRARRHPAFGTAGGPPPNYRLPEANIRYDARRSLEGWQTADVTDWPPAVDGGPAGGPPWGDLVERPIGLWRDAGLRDYVEVTEQDAGGERVLVGRLPYNAQVHPALDITAPAGLTIDLRTDLGRDGFVRAQYVTRAGRQRFECWGWMNGHAVRYRLPAAVVVHGLQFRETGYPADFVGRFHCDNERLNTLWTKARRTLYVTMRDNYMDCPDRERAQWWGDAVNEIGEAFYVFDAVRGPQLARKAMLELAAYQRADHTLYSPVPAGVPAGDDRDNAQDGSWNRELPRQMLASVGTYGFWTYYRYTGDAGTIRRVYPAVRDYLAVWRQDERGLVVHRTGEWDWTDWGRHKDVAVLENAWFHLALRGARHMAELLGEDRDAAVYAQRMARIEAAFNATFWQQDHYRSPAHQGEIDDRAQALSVVAGLARPADYPAIAQVLATQFHASPYMEKYVLEALFLMGRPQAAIDRMLARYGPMIDAPQTTLWENFPRPGHDEPGSGTYNHAWSGGPLTLMHQYIAGIAPLAPGFRRFAVRPQLGPLRSVRSTVPTVHGDIRLTVNREGGRALAIDLTVPPGTAAEVTVGSWRRNAPAGRHRWHTGSVEDGQGTGI